MKNRDALIKSFVSRQTRQAGNPTRSFQPVGGSRNRPNPAFRARQDLLNQKARRQARRY